MLSTEDLARRATFIGASEIAAVCGIDPRQSPWDVWARKMTPTRGPLATYSQPTTVESMAGHLFEPAILGLYGFVTGATVERNEASLVHAAESHLGATPDGFVVDAVLSSTLRRRLVQIKARGWRSTERTEFLEGRVPDVIRLQVMQEIHVARSHYPELVDGDVVAQLELTGAPAIFRIEYDHDLMGEVLDIADRFWRDYVLGDKPPPQGKLEPASDYLAKRFPADNGGAVALDSEQLAYAEQTAELYVYALRDAAAASRHVDEMAARIKELMGDGKVLELVRGKFTWSSRVGSIFYKSLAEHLAGGEIPPDLVELHRGSPSRVFRFDAATK